LSYNELRESSATDRTLLVHSLSHNTGAIVQETSAHGSPQTHSEEAKLEHVYASQSYPLPHPDQLKSYE